MTKQDAAEVISSLETTGVQAIPELAGRPDAFGLIEALIEGGIRCIEVLLPGQRGIDQFREVVNAFGERAHIGAGSVVDSAFAEAVLDAGASIVVTPVVSTDVVRVVKVRGRIAICGALTPTECVQATQAGSDFVKLFPGNAFSHAVLRTLLVPLPDLRIVVAGGVNADNAGRYILAGARAVAAGYYLVGSCERPFSRDAIIERCQTLLESVRSARATLHL